MICVLFDMHIILQLKVWKRFYTKKQSLTPALIDRTEAQRGQRGDEVTVVS